MRLPGHLPVQQSTALCSPKKYESQWKITLAQMEAIAEPDPSGTIDEVQVYFNARSQLAYLYQLEGKNDKALQTGDALLKALPKFAEAEKYAPNWGRLHLKWGEALVYAGKVGEAKVQFARAAALDLTPPEKAELARHP